MSNVDILVVIDADTIVKGAQGIPPQTGGMTPATATNLGSWGGSDQWVYMITDLANVISDEGHSELSISCGVGDDLNWWMTNPSAGRRYGCLLDSLIPGNLSAWDESLSPPEFQSQPVWLLQYSSESPGFTQVPGSRTYVTSTAIASTTQQLQYTCVFQIVDLYTNNSLGYFSWDPFITVAAA
jgi:hypothetical protein